MQFWLDRLTVILGKVSYTTGLHGQDQDWNRDARKTPETEP